MTLELKHLAPYLPYRLEVLFESKHRRVMVGLKNKILYYEYDEKEILGENFVDGIFSCKPILRPLSDLKGKDYDLIRSFEACSTDELNDVLKQCPECLTYESILYLFEWHFDVFRLIEKGLAIDINTLNS